VLASVTEGEDKPVKYPTAYRWADLVVLTKTDLADVVGFDENAFRRSVAEVHSAAPVVRTSARTGEGVDDFLERLLALLAPIPEPEHT
jgi:hydrogenase nickel incorporation protein HypB